jgi:type I restriction enzyme S subunit
MTEAGVPLRAIYQRVEERNRADLPLLSVYREFGVVRREGRDDNNNVASEDLSSYKVVRPGDLVLNKMKTWQGSLGVSSFQGIVSPAYFVGRRIADVDDRFMHHLLRSAPMIAEYGSRSKGIRPNQWDLPWDEFAAIKINLPSRSMQTAIARVLDRELSKIEALVSKKQRMIELLEERLRGWALDLTASNAMSPLRRVVSAVKTGTTPASGAYGRSDEIDNGLEWVTPGDFGTHIYLGIASRSVELSAVRDREVPVHPAGTVLLVGVGATTGKVAFADRSVSSNQQITGLVPSSDTDGRYLAWQLWARKDEIRDTAPYATLPIISNDFIKSLAISFPPLTEQVYVVRQLDDLANLTGRLTTDLMAQVVLLQERRQALITEAVTGQLDIPEVAA